MACSLVIGNVPIQKLSPFSFSYRMEDSILDLISRQEVWDKFLAHRLVKGRLSWSEFSCADEFVESESYLPLAARLSSGGSLGVPRMMVVNKMGTGKKRTVYSFGPDEMAVLKLISHLLYRYDGAFSSGCYAFRKGLRPSDAIRSLLKALDGREMWAYKLDIHDYFNSIPIPLLLPALSDLLKDDPRLMSFFEKMLSDGRAEYNGAIINEFHGVMAGTPTSPFLANVYLKDVDRHFVDNGVIYARYSDDIILFAPSREEIEEYKAELLGFLKERQLEVNPDKEKLYSPEEPFEFLGYKCHGREIDISGVTITKMKGRIRRAARSLERRRDRGLIDPVNAMRKMIGRFNMKFFDEGDPDSLTWSKWYFPVINRTEGLSEIDHYFQQRLRFLGSGKKGKSSYRVRYSFLKDLGYKSLVHEYHEYRERFEGKDLISR